MGKIAFLFAGQGAQYPGMGKSLYECSPAARAAFDEAERMRPGTIEQCFSSDMETLTKTINTQPCLFTMDYACAAALREAGIEPDMAMGFSLGEIAAIAFSDLLPFKEAFALVCERAMQMQACASRHPGAMDAVMRLDADTVEELAATVKDVYPVNYNCPGQTVVSGTEEALPAFEKLVAEQGGKFLRLKVGGCFHTPFMADAATALLAFMKNLPFQAPRIPLYANATAERYGTDPADLIARQVKSPVLFQKGVENMVAAGCDTFVEVGAGKTLTGLVKKIDPEVRAFHVEDADTLAAAIEQLKGGAS